VRTRDRERKDGKSHTGKGGGKTAKKKEERQREKA